MMNANGFGCPGLEKKLGGVHEIAIREQAGLEGITEACSRVKGHEVIVIARGAHLEAIRVKAPGAERARILGLARRATDKPVKSDG